MRCSDFFARYFAPCKTWTSHSTTGYLIDSDPDVNRDAVHKRRMGYVWRHARRQLYCDPISVWFCDLCFVVNHFLIMVCGVLLIAFWFSGLIRYRSGFKRSQVLLRCSSGCLGGCPGKAVDLRLCVRSYLDCRPGTLKARKPPISQQLSRRRS